MFDADPFPGDVLHQAGAALGIDTRSHRAKTRDSLQLAVDIANAEAKARPQRVPSSPQGSLLSSVTAPPVYETSAVPPIQPVDPSKVTRFGLNIPR